MHPPEIVFYADTNLWGSITFTMQRLTARFLLLFALAGTFLPVALQALAAPPHACCRRNAAHHCHGSAASDPDAPLVRDSSCCHHDCCRGATTVQWAHTQPAQMAVTAQSIAAGEMASQPIAAVPEFFPSRSPRAPPAC